MKEKEPIGNENGGIKLRVEDEVVDVFIFQRRYTTQQWVNICKAIRKRHPLDDWFYEELNWDKSSVAYISAEAIAWIDAVYHRGEKNYLDAEIAFSVSAIEKMDALKLEKFNQDYEDMTVEELSDYFEVRKEVVRNGISKLKITTITTANNKLKKVNAEDVRRLEQIIFKKKYWKRLEEVRLCLKKEKSIH